MILEFGHQTPLARVKIDGMQIFRYRPVDTQGEEFRFAFQHPPYLDYSQIFNKIAKSEAMEENVTLFYGEGNNTFLVAISTVEFEENYKNERLPSEKYLFELQQDGTLWLRGEKLVHPVKRLAYVPRSESGETEYILAYENMINVFYEDVLWESIKGSREVSDDEYHIFYWGKKNLIATTVEKDNAFRKQNPELIKKNERFRVDITP